MSVPRPIPLTVIDDLQAGRPLSTDGCLRCGLAHSGLWLRPFEPPIAVAEGVSITHWAMCPVADAPILLLATEVE